MKKKYLIYRICTVMLCLMLMIGAFPISGFAAKEMFSTYEITDVTITGIDAPKAGEKFDFTAEEVSQKYNIIKVAWQAQYRNDYITSTSSTASAGTKYTVFVVLEVATPNHYFKTGEGRVTAVPSVHLNGNTATANNAMDYTLFSIDASKYEHDTTYQKYLTVSYTFPATEAQTDIKDVAVINLIEPISGASPVFTADTPMGSGYYVSQIRWCKVGASADMTVSDKFEYGQRYIAFIDITAENGYNFWASTYMTGTVNGTKAPGFTADGTASKVTMMAEFTATGDPIIYNIDIKDVKVPTAGESPAYSATLVSSGYTRTDRSDAYYKNGMCWSVEGGSYITTSGQAFSPITKYQIDIRIKPANGFAFATKANGDIDLKATVNGQNATVAGNKNEIIVTYVFPATGSIALSKVGVTDIDVPVTGQSPDYTASYSNINYGAANYNDKSTKNGISWYNETDGKIMSTSDKFEAGKSYTVQVIIWTKDGYEFQYKFGAVNVAGMINGNSAEVSSRNNEEVTLYYTFPKTEAHRCSPLKVDEVKATCKEIGKKAYYFCPECGKNFEDSKCTTEISDINAWGFIEKTEHTGGKATCKEQAQCKNCGERYGNLAEHSYGTAWDYKDASGHAHTCKVCGEHDTVKSHTGGTVKCGEKAKCTECKSEYGEPGNHKWSTKWDYTDSKGHSHKCTVCGEHDTVQAHTGGTADCQNKAKCSVCGTEYGKTGDHKWSTKWDYTDSKGHSHKCTVCGEHDTVQAHTGGTADCQNKAKCSACGTEYGKTGDHKWSTKWDFTDTKGHAHKCTVCGEHDAIVKHTPGASATETSPQTCTTCNYVIEPAKEHKHNLTKVAAVDADCTNTGKEQHYVCDGCGKIFSDSKGTKEITDKDSLIIPAVGHKESKWKSNSDTHWKECTAKGCGVIIEGTTFGHEFGKNNKCTVCGYKQEDEQTENTTPNQTETDEPKTEDNLETGGNDKNDPDKNDPSENISENTDNEESNENGNTGDQATKEPNEDVQNGDEPSSSADSGNNTALLIITAAAVILAAVCMIVMTAVLLKKNKRT